MLTTDLPLLDTDGHHARRDRHDRRAPRHRRHRRRRPRRVEGVLTAGDLSRLIERDTNIMATPARDRHDAQSQDRRQRRAGERGRVSHGAIRHHVNAGRRRRQARVAASFIFTI